jgi:hypothetical protein
MPVSVATMHRQLGNCLAVARENHLEWLDVLEFRVLLHHRGHPVEAVDDLRIDRVFDPERAILVKGGDAFFGLHKLRACPVGRGLDEVEDRLFCGTIVP